MKSVVAISLWFGTVCSVDRVKIFAVISIFVC